MNVHSAERLLYDTLVDAAYLQHYKETLRPRNDATGRPHVRSQQLALQPHEKTLSTTTRKPAVIFPMRQAAKIRKRI